MSQTPVEVEYKRAFEALLRAHAAVIRSLNQKLSAADVVPPEIYEALLALEECEYKRLTMGELAARVMLSPSGVTRLIDRMVKLGYVERESNVNDRRSLYAKITKKGLQAREEAWPVMEQSIRTDFAVHLSPEEANVFADLLQRFIREGIGTGIYTGK